MPSDDRSGDSGMAPEMTYVQYASRHGLVTDYDVQGHIHGGLMAAHMPRSYHRNYQRKLAQLQQAREDGLAQYRDAIARGEIAEPRTLTGIEKLRRAAAGHPDLESTKAAQRVLARIEMRRASA